MREILFKGKRKDNSKWVEGYYVKEYDLLGNEWHLIFHVDSYRAWEYAEIDPETLCQFTGLCDKNGKMIWENDILRYSYDYPDSPWLTAKGLTNDDIKYSVGAVFWHEWRGSWAVCGNGKSRMTNQDVFTYCRNPNRTEVIGNIFDNQELLKGSI